MLLNAFKKFYPEITGKRIQPSALHAILGERTDDDISKLMKRPFPKKVTFHDPCYFGRA
jgi:Fe-S oxidoreductase